MKSAALHCLKLEDGQVWEFVSTNGAEVLLEKMAYIMELSCCPAGTGQKMIFFCGNLRDKPYPDFTHIESTELANLPKSGWSVTKLNHVHIWRNQQTSDILCEFDKRRGKSLDFRRILQSIYPVYSNTITNGGIPLHSALLEYYGKGVLILATSGTGKSTCCSRVESPWHPVCDDEALVVRMGEGFRVHPFPTWNDYIVRHSNKTVDVQRNLPLSAIFFLQRSASDRVEPASKGIVAYSLYRSSLQIFDRYKLYLGEAELHAANKQMFENACLIPNTVPSYVLHASLRGRFWEEMKKVIPIDK